MHAIGASIMALKNQSMRWNKSAANALSAIAGLLTLAVLLLLYFLLQRNFQLEYVAGYTDISLPTFYVVSALWAGQEGSLLFWGWLFSLCCAWCIIKYPQELRAGGYKQSHDLPGASIFRPELPYMYIIFSLTLGFFLVLLAFEANPFKLLAFTPPNGKGMNPLLQNPYMVIHPPVLFIGYAGFIVPFALAFAALCTGTIGHSWLRAIRRWTLFSWYFLGIGIVLGAHWAYLELGWGGYWAWDPVENASFIPWLTGTALLHTLILQRQKGLLKLWNIFACILTFSLCILATFITRSGIISSVHAFGESAIGFYFLSFLIVVALGSAGLMIYRWKTFRSYSDQSFLYTKENSFFLINQLFIGLSFAILYGTIYPTLSELTIGKKVVIRPLFYNRVAILVGLIILALIGICQRLPWKNVSLAALRDRFWVPLGIMLAALVLFFALGIRQIPLLLTCGLSVFVIATICIDIGELARILPAKNAEAEGKRLTRTHVISRFLAGGQKGRITSHIFHLGMVLIFVGIAVSATYKLEKEVALRPGESTNLGNIRFQYVKLSSREDTQNVAVLAEIGVYNDEEQIATLIPEKRFYGQEPNEQVTTEIGLRTSLTKDIYVILGGWDEDQQATFLFIIYPMIIWIWIGGFLVFTIGIIVVILPKSRVRYK